MRYDERTRSDKPRGPSWQTWSDATRPADNPPPSGFNAWDERVRMRQNIGAAIAVIILGITTYVVFDQLQASSRVLACMEAGHRNCAPLNIERPAPR
ncbi:hypothetical protein [Phreatobacter sp. AB_2022a]|uniref:hypothetical protein n=1 Tax=Phreatobacter sp. AB_2022a TaxID=3003134 RepID=UPI002286D739|nr:hypothetical protein [Phreatobacter sp. AB_2022a]MCZ0736397.1 hypothetical protein [Phreatobacter sp. AB_2022a]